MGSGLKRHAACGNGILADLEEDGRNEGRDEEEDELLDVPGTPEHPLTQAHHQHRLADAGLLLKNELLNGHQRKGTL